MSQKPKGPGTIINDENVESFFYVYVNVNRKERPYMCNYMNQINWKDKTRRVKASVGSFRVSIVTHWYG